MPPAPIPVNEASRLAALRALDILDSPPEIAFDRITRLAARLLDTPIAVVSLVDAEREWFKSCVGVDEGEADRKIAFCAHTILSNVPLNVPDALADSRFADNPQVVQGGIRSYLGVPLVTGDGHNMGALCVKDVRPREFSRDQVSTLEDLAAVVVRELELRRSAEALRLSDERYRLAARAADDVIWDLDLVTDRIEWNDAFERKLGHPVNQATSSLEFWKAHVHPDDLDRVSRSLSTAILSNASTWSEEYRFRRGDGSYAVVLDRGFVARDAEGRARRMIGTLVDLTERDRIEQTLKTSVRQLESFVADAPASVAMFDRNMRYLNVSQAWMRDYGLIGRNIIGLSHYEVFPEIGDAWKQVHQRCLAGAIERCEEDRFERLDGSVTWLEWEVRPWFDESGHIGGITMFTKDITDRKLAEKQRQASQQLLRTIIDNIPQRIFWKDLDGVYVGANRQFMSDAGTVDFIGRTDFDMPWKPEEAAWYRECDQRVIRTDQPELNIVETLKNAQGENLWLSTSKFPLKDETGAIIGIVGTYLDITQIKRVQDELELARDAAESANRAKSEFLANMSHEIRTPMTAILGYADLLMDPSLTSSDRVDHIRTIQRSGHHLLSVINDILDLSKIEAGKMTIEHQPCDTIAMIAEVTDLLRVRAEDKRLSFTVEYSGRIPAVIHTDPIRLRQILMNLLGNAIKFTDQGGVRLLVRSNHDGRSGGHSLCIDVIDTGIGLTREQIASLFRPFTQADASPTRRHGGSGLGLTISKSLANMLQGEIRVVSTPRCGSCFTLEIPIELTTGVAMIDTATAQAATSRAAALKTGSESNLSARPLANLRVLVAEDGPDNQRLFTHLLKRAGASVEIAENGRVAVSTWLQARASGRPIDVVLMDMQMPELDGYAATRALRAEGFNGPVIALTAHAMSGDREKCMQAGCDDYLTKPINQNGLLSRIVDAVRRRPASSAAPSALITEKQIHD